MTGAKLEGSQLRSSKGGWRDAFSFLHCTLQCL